MAVSFGAYIHGTTVVYPAVAIPSLKKSNGTNQKDEDAVLPFHITDDDISLIGKVNLRQDEYKQAVDHNCLLVQYKK